MKQPKLEDLTKAELIELIRQHMSFYLTQGKINKVRWRSLSRRAEEAAKQSIEMDEPTMLQTLSAQLDLLDASMKSWEKAMKLEKKADQFYNQFLRSKITS